jgi:hypothetical protein
MLIVVFMQKYEVQGKQTKAAGKIVAAGPVLPVALPRRSLTTWSQVGDSNDA